MFNFLKSLLGGLLGSAHDLAASAMIRVRRLVGFGVIFYNVYEFECLGSDGKVKWTEKVRNRVVNTGLDDILTNYWKGSSYTSSHFVGLTDGTPTDAAADTMASHAGWTEVVAYSESTREALTLGTVASQSVDNSASKASFSINTNSTTVGGAFVTTNSTKSGTSGTLIGIAAFTGADKSVDDGDTLNVTVTLTAANG